MIDLKFFTENPEIFVNGARNKGINLDAEILLEQINQRKKLTLEVQDLREQRNKCAKERKIEEGRRIKQELDKKELKLKTLEENLQENLFAIPNVPKNDVKVGKDETENEVIRHYKKPPEFDFTPKDHLALGEALGMIDTERASKVSGARFAYLKNDAVFLEFALARFAFDFLVKKGFLPVLPPVLIKKETMRGLGYLENGGEDDMFVIPKDNLVLVATAEQSLVPMHQDEVLSFKDLPLRYVGYSASFRREAGSYGKDTRGILRVHQFNKVEMISYVAEGMDDQEQEYLLSLEEEMFQALEIPYRVIKMCTGDLGFPAARKYDLEAWMPGQNKYREVTSVSTVTDFQARRLNIRYQEGKEKKFVNILNGTAFAMSRTPIAILENYQQKDGSIIIPEVLRPYMGKDKIVSSQNVIR